MFLCFEKASMCIRSCQPINARNAPPCHSSLTLSLGSFRRMLPLAQKVPISLISFPLTTAYSHCKHAVVAAINTAEPANNLQSHQHFHNHLLVVMCALTQPAAAYPTTQRWDKDKSG